MSAGLFLLSMGQTFPFDRAAPGETGCLQIGAIGSAGEAGSEELESSLPLPGIRAGPAGLC